jgi:hypothetical protein
VDLYIRIEDAAIGRLSWDDLMEVIDAEIDSTKKEALRVIKTARREFGLEVGDGTSQTEIRHEV